ncbi:hypothetical protein [Gluconobacter potus]|uniref:hypothetical protein n=1 Tax=Gluconobacter potus TaxID=2724927 RepID=UPI0039EAFE47
MNNKKRINISYAELILSFILFFSLQTIANASDIMNEVRAERASGVDFLILKQEIRAIEERWVDPLSHDPDDVDVFVDNKQEMFILNVTRAALHLSMRQCENIASYYSEHVYGKNSNRAADFTSFIGSSVFQNSTGDRPVNEMNDLLDHTTINISNNHSAENCSLNVGTRHFVYRERDDQ